MKTLATTVTAVAIIGTPAFAADMALRARPQPPALAPVYSTWNGFYLGVNAGYSWSHNGVDTTASPGPFDVLNDFGGESNVAAALATTSLGPKQRGFTGGGQIGYNWQFTPQWVGGLEADIQGLSHSNDTASITSASGVPGFPLETFVSTTTVTNRVDWLGTVRARLGFLVTPTLLAYGTGGLAYGKVEGSTNIAQSDSGITNNNGVLTGTAASAGSFSETRAGWTIGGGLEWMFLPHWTLKGEYLFYDLGSVSWGSPNLVFNVPGFASPTFSAVNIGSSTHFNGNIVRAGINYKF